MNIDEIEPKLLALEEKIGAIDNLVNALRNIMFPIKEKKCQHVWQVNPMDINLTPFCRKCGHKGYSDD
jgi:hypothetical protein